MSGGFISEPFILFSLILRISGYECLCSQFARAFSVPCFFGGKSAKGKKISNQHSANIQYVHVSILHRSRCVLPNRSIADKNVHTYNQPISHILLLPNNTNNTIQQKCIASLILTKQALQKTFVCAREKERVCRPSKKDVKTTKRNRSSNLAIGTPHSGLEPLTFRYAMKSALYLGIRRKFEITAERATNCASEDCCV